jgi:hypothetical protein
VIRANKILCKQRNFWNVALDLAGRVGAVCDSGILTCNTLL